MMTRSEKFTLLFLIGLYLSRYSEGKPAEDEILCNDRLGGCLNGHELQSTHAPELKTGDQYPVESLTGSNHSVERQAVPRSGLGYGTLFHSNQKPSGFLDKLPPWIFKVADLIPDICEMKKQLVGPTPVSYAVGGEYAYRNEFPWMAGLLWDNGSHLVSACAGSLITDRHVLTAGHCLIKRRPEEKSWILRSVQLGNWDSRFDPNCFKDTDNPWSPEIDCAVRIPIARIFLHENFQYHDKWVKNDIALLQLSDPVKSNNRIRPICLPQSANIFPKLYAAGWGLSEKGPFSRHLIKVELPLFDLQKCAIHHPNVTTGEVCAGGERGRDTCVGDSGGPLVQLDQFVSYQYEIVGITSYGSSNCGKEGEPAVYTRVHHYLPWILSKIRFSVDL